MQRAGSDVRGRVLDDGELKLVWRSEISVWIRTQLRSRHPGGDTWPNDNGQSRLRCDFVLVMDQTHDLGAHAVVLPIVQEFAFHTVLVEDGDTVC